MSVPDNLLPIQRGVGDRTPCARHPAVLTFLRCARCGVAICPSCAAFSAEGACCPDCARQLAKHGERHTRVGGSPGRRVIVALVCGLVIAGIGGVALSVVPARSLLIVPLLLMGLTVGEAMASLTGRRGSASLGLLAMACTIGGPLLGIAAWRAVSMHLGLWPGVPSEQPDAAGPLELVLLIVAGGLAAWRARSSGSVTPFPR